MADPKTVSPQVTDSVTQANTKVLGDSPAVAMGTLYQAAAHSMGLAMQNAVNAQQNMNVVAEATTQQAVRSLLGVDQDLGPGLQELLNVPYMAMSDEENN